MLLTPDSPALLNLLYRNLLILQLEDTSAVVAITTLFLWGTFGIIFIPPTFEPLCHPLSLLPYFKIIKSAHSRKAIYFLQ